MAYGIKLQGLAGDVAVHEGGGLGQWVKSYDPDAFGGKGDVGTTANPQEALRFTDAWEAAEFYRQPSKVRPRREDGFRNRPLTAFTVSIEKIADRKDGANEDNG